MQNLDLKVGKFVIKKEAIKVDINNAMNLLGIIGDKTLERRNKKSAMRCAKVAQILGERYK